MATNGASADSAARAYPANGPNGDRYGLAQEDENALKPGSSRHDSNRSRSEGKNHPTIFVAPTHGGMHGTHCERQQSAFMNGAGNYLNWGDSRRYSDCSENGSGMSCSTKTDL